MKDIKRESVFELIQSKSHNTRVFIFTGLLKQFIRELPAPLLTFEYLEAFVQVDGKRINWLKNAWEI